MRKATLVGVVALIGLPLAWELVPLQVMLWDGRFHLTVDVAPEGELPRRVSCQVFPWREQAEQAVEAAEVHETTWTHVVSVAPFTGQPLVVDVQCSGRSSPLGRETAWSQFGYLVVVAEWADGRRVAKLIPTPNGQVSRSVRVSVP